MNSCKNQNVSCSDFDKTHKQTKNAKFRGCCPVLKGAAPFKCAYASVFQCKQGYKIKLGAGRTVLGGSWSVGDEGARVRMGTHTTNNGQRPGAGRGGWPEQRQVGQERRHACFWVLGGLRACVAGSHQRHRVHEKGQYRLIY